MLQIKVPGSDSLYDNEGGERTAVGAHLGGGMAALVVLQGTNNKTTVGATTNATVLLAARADQSRVGGSIFNAANTTLHVELPAGDTVIAPGKRVGLPEGYQGEIGGWWEGSSPIGNAYVSEITI